MIVTVAEWEEVGPLTGDRVKTRKMRFSNVFEQALFLRNMVDRYRQSQQIRELAIDIVFHQRHLPPKAKAAHALAIGEWVQDNVIYVNEFPELFQTPLRTLRLGAGDCDDGTTLTCSLLESIGIPSRLVALELAQRRPASGRWMPWEQFSPAAWKHIFPAALVPMRGRQFELPLDWSLSIPVSRLTNPVALALRRGDRVRTMAV